jgi:hypothetical protein
MGLDLGSVYHVTVVSTIPWPQIASSTLHSLLASAALSGGGMDRLTHFSACLSNLPIWSLQSYVSELHCSPPPAEMVGSGYVSIIFTGLSALLTLKI